MAFWWGVRGGGGGIPINPDISQTSLPSLALVLEVCHLRFISLFESVILVF